MPTQSSPQLPDEKKSGCFCLVKLPPLEKHPCEVMASGLGNSIARCLPSPASSLWGERIATFEGLTAAETAESCEKATRAAERSVEVLIVKCMWCDVRGRVSRFWRRSRMLVNQLDLAPPGRTCIKPDSRRIGEVVVVGATINRHGGEARREWSQTRRVENVLLT